METHQHGATSGDIITSHQLLDVFEHTLMITFFVLVTMLLIEYISIQVRGRWHRPVPGSTGLKLFSAGLLGIMPGCLGTFTAVSLYIHKIFGFPALLTNFIATSGDESFVMFSLFPGKAFLLNIILLIVSLFAGIIAYLFLKDKHFLMKGAHELPHHHDEPLCIAFIPKDIVPHLKKISFTRALLISGGVLFLLYHFSTWNSGHLLLWEKVTYVALTSIGLFIITTVPDHFLNEHLWKHTIKRHLPRIFAWTLIAFLAIEILLGHLHLEEWIRSNAWMILLLGLLVGLIPQSGPHLIFVTLFASGSIPFSILLANSIVQDGHGGIPLLAESPVSFIMVKLVKFIIGLAIGSAGLLMGF